MIKVHCHSNLDDYQRVCWPKYFCCRPSVGDCVEGMCGKTLRICCITHKEDLRPVNHEDEQFYLDIELTKRI